MQCYLVRFAAEHSGEARNYLIDDKVYDRWVQGEPPEGYGCFVLLWCGPIEGVYTALNDLRDICQHKP